MIDDAIAALASAGFDDPTAPKPAPEAATAAAATEAEAGGALGRQLYGSTSSSTPPAFDKSWTLSYYKDTPYVGSSFASPSCQGHSAQAATDRYKLMTLASWWNGHTAVFSSPTSHVRAQYSIPYNKVCTACRLPPRSAYEAQG